MARIPFNAPGTWLFDKNIKLSSIMLLVPFTITTMDGTEHSCTQIYVPMSPTKLSFTIDGEVVTVYDSSGWVDERYRTITITGEGTIPADIRSTAAWFFGNVTPAVPHSTIITYNGNEITTLEAGQTATLKCEGKKMKTDVAVYLEDVGYLTFIGVSGALAPLTLKTSKGTKSWDGTLEYSTDAITWRVWDGTTTLSANDHGELYLRGTGNTKITGGAPAEGFNSWVLEGLSVCKGNIENLLDYQTVARGEHPIMAEYCYAHMFDSCGLVIAPTLPATTLTKGCYYGMFNNCQSLIKAPALPATTLAEYCYFWMLHWCTSLTTIPALPATTLAEYCYFDMFSMSDKIKLSATQTDEYQIEYRIPISGEGTTATGALGSMFYGTGGTFTSAPEINTTYYTSNEVVYADDPETPKITIIYNGIGTAAASEKTATFKCEGKKMKTDVVINRKDIGYLTFSSPSSFTLNVVDNTKYWDGTLEYSTDATVWNVWDGTTTLSADSGKLYMRGTGNTCITGTNADYDTAKWVLTGSDISCSGNIENLLDYITVLRGEHPSMGDGCYKCLFMSCTNLISAPELPATTLTVACYRNMFNGCTGLTTAPDLPATNAPTTCCYGMFEGTSITTAPKLPVATEAASFCYYRMFRDCTSLTTAPELPATTLEDNCYKYMFYGCTSLIAAPELPATTVGDYCYQEMFSGCTSLVTSPELIAAATLPSNCCYRMFYGCTSLTTAPAIPATTLGDNCCNQMFAECTALIILPKIFATIFARNCCGGMFGGCTQIKLSTTQTDEYQTAYRIPTSGTPTVFNQYALSGMFGITGGTFVGSPIPTKTYYTSNTVV